MEKKKSLWSHYKIYFMLAGRSLTCSLKINYYYYYSWNCELAFLCSRCGEDAKDEAKMLKLRWRCWSWGEDIEPEVKMMKPRWRRWSWGEDVEAEVNMLKLRWRWWSWCEDDEAEVKILKLMWRWWSWGEDVEDEVKMLKDNIVTVWKPVMAAIIFSFWVQLKKTRRRSVLL